MRLASLDTSEVRACAKCGATQPPLYRHHKGFDSMLGWYNKGIRFRYYDYLDCVTLCFQHHLEIHFIYQRYTDRWVNRTPRGALSFRHQLIKVCDSWLEGKIATPKIPKTFSVRFQTSLDEWEKVRDARRAKGSR